MSINVSHRRLKKLVLTKTEENEIYIDERVEKEKVLAMIESVMKV